MATNQSRFAQEFRKLMEKVAEQPWYQELKTKWEELDSQTRLSIKLGATVGGVLLGFLYVIILGFGTYRLKSEWEDKMELTQLLSSANSEVRKIRQQNRANDRGAARESSREFIMKVAEESRISSDKVQVSEEKQGDASSITQESLFDITLAKVNVRQVVRYAFHLENSSHPAKVRNLVINTQGVDGFMDARLSVSIFRVKDSK